MCFRDDPEEFSKLLRDTADLVDHIRLHEMSHPREYIKDIDELGIKIIDIYVNINGVMTPEIDKDALVHAFF